MRHMKTFIALLFIFISFQAFSASTTQVEVISAEFPVEDFDQRKTLCLTIVRVPVTGKLLGVVEDIRDCFYARTAKKSHNHKLHLPLSKFHKITHPEMREHLQRLDTQLEFYFSDGE